MKATLPLSGNMSADFVAKGYWERITIPQLCNINASLFGEECAIVDSKRRITWAQLKIESDRIAVHLRKLGVKKDDIFMVVLPNIVENFTVRVALYKAGVLGAFPPMTFREAELKAGLSRLGARGAIFPHQYKSFDYHDFFIKFKPQFSDLKYLFVSGPAISTEAESLDDIATNHSHDEGVLELPEDFGFDPFETSMIFTSSGSSGLPKLVEQNQASHLAMGKNLRNRLNLVHADVIGIFIPLSAGPGTMFFFSAMQLGSEVVLMDDYHAEEAFGLIEREKITAVTTTTAVVVRMAESAALDEYDISSLKVIRCGAAPISPSDAKRAEEKLGCVLATAAGSAEGYFTQSSVTDSTYTRQFTVGKIIEGNEARIVDSKGKEVGCGVVGELWVRGAGCNLGYYKDREATRSEWTEEGWYKSGDLVKKDREGNLAFVGRKKEMIIRGGQNIYPREIETVLSLHPKIGEVAIIGIPDPIMGEKACACIVKKEGPLEAEDVVDFLREQKLALFKYPERVEFFDELPLLGSLKIDKMKLKSLVKARSA